MSDFIKDFYTKASDNFWNGFSSGLEQFRERYFDSNIQALSMGKQFVRWQGDANLLWRPLISLASSNSFSNWSLSEEKNFFKVFAAHSG